jgi:rod shape-determining protein MreC
LPVQWLVLQPGQLASAISDYFQNLEQAQKNLLTAQLKALQQSARSHQVEQLLKENQNLRQLLDLKPTFTTSSQVAEVLFDVPDPYTQRIVIDKGQAKNVALGSPVIDAGGVVGQVTRVFPLSSEVTLITDRDQAIPVLNVRTGARGVAYGETTRNADALELRFMAANADVTVGDVLTTSGVDGVYPPGLPVARVDKVERRTEAVFARIECVPIAMVAGTRHVLVLQPAAQAAVARPPPEPEHKPVRTGGRR